MTGMGKVGSAHSLKPAVKSTNGFHDKADEESDTVYISESECRPIMIYRRPLLKHPICI